MKAARKRNSDKDSDARDYGAVESGDPRRASLADGKASDQAAAKRSRGRPRKQPRPGHGGGPKTPAGKKRSSQNALRHGAYSDVPIIPGESAEEHQAHVAGIMEALDLHGPLEQFYGRRIALLLWRIDRVPRYESAVVTNAMTSEAESGDAEEERVVDSDGFHYMLGGAFHVDKILRMEGHLHRLLIQTQNQLEAIQARRSGKPTHLTRVDVSSPPTFRNTRAPKLGDAFPLAALLED